MTSVTWDARNLPDTYVESLQKCHTTCLLHLHPGAGVQFEFLISETRVRRVHCEFSR